MQYFLSCVRGSGLLAESDAEVAYLPPPALLCKVSCEALAMMLHPGWQDGCAFHTDSYVPGCIFREKKSLYPMAVAAVGETSRGAKSCRCAIQRQRQRHSPKRTNESMPLSERSRLVMVVLVERAWRSACVRQASHSSIPQIHVDRLNALAMQASQASGISIPMAGSRPQHG